MRCGAGALLLLTVVLSQGCADRAPVVVAQASSVGVTQPQDHLLDCPAIFAEIQATAQMLAGSANAVDRKALQRNGAGGQFIGTQLYGSAQAEAEKEVRALEVRSQHLLTLAQQKRC